MNKSKLFSTILFFCVLGMAQVQAQNYKSAVGARLGYPYSLSYKAFISKPGAVEVTAGYRNWSGKANYSTITAAYQHHIDFESIEDLKWYVGAGVGANFWGYKGAYSGDKATLTVFGALGLDYKVPKLPLNFSIDWQPTFFLGSGYYDGFGGGYGGIAVRYVIK